MNDQTKFKVGNIIKSKVTGIEYEVLEVNSPNELQVKNIKLGFTYPLRVLDGSNFEVLDKPKDSSGNEDHMVLKKLGFYTKPKRGTRHDLSQYKIDSAGNVYTENRKTYFTKFGFHLVESSGKDDTVTLRDSSGNKVSILRSKLKRVYNNDKLIRDF